MSEVRLPAPVKATVLAKDEFHRLQFAGDRFPGGELPAGAIAFNGDPPVHLMTCCPCGCGMFAMLPIRDHPNDFRGGWCWNGDREAPTLEPSIRHGADDGGTHWHGFLRAGMWTQA